VDDFPVLVAKWARRICELDMQWVVGAIFPTEMAMFLATCEAAQVDGIIESGRQDGYSTVALADYAGLMDVPVISMDLPDTPERGARTRARLAGRPNLRLLDGNSLRILPRAVPPTGGRLALLVDGPKGDVANSLMVAACAAYPIAVLGYHGHHPGTADGAEREVAFPSMRLVDPFAYERVPEMSLLIERERSLTAGVDMGVRAFGKITLAIASIDPSRSVLRAFARDPVHLPRRLVRFAFDFLRGDRTAAPPPELLLLVWSLGSRR
jgi:hypothetical protein